MRLASSSYAEAGAPTALEHARFEGDHPLTRERFEHILSWLTSAASATRRGSG